MSIQVDILGNSAKFVKDDNHMMGFHVEINGKSYSGARATLEVTDVVGSLWAVFNDPVTFTGILTGVFRTTVGAIATGVNAGRLIYRDVSGYLYGN